MLRWTQVESDDEAALGPDHLDIAYWRNNLGRVL